MKKFTLQFVVSTFFLLLSNYNLFAQISFTANTTQGCTPLTVIFTNTSSDPNAYTYEWYFQDGTPMYSEINSTTVSHTFNTPGYYNVYILVYNNIGNSVGYAYCNNGNIHVEGLSINSPDSLCVNEPFGFCTSANYPTNVSWNFGDPGSGANNTANQNCPTHTFSTIGTYTLTVTATTNCGTQTATKTLYVTNLSYPQSYFWVNPNPVCPNSPVGFNTNTYAVYSWNFGDPGSGALNSSTLQQPQHTYSVVGKYYATLTVTNGCGHSNTYGDTIRVSTTVGFPGGMAIGNPTITCPNQQVNCYVYGGSNYPKYVWNFGDGSPKDSTSSSLNHNFGNALATYTISCKVTNACGRDTTFFSTISVTNYAPFPNQSWFKMDVNSSPSCPNSNVNFNAPNGYNTYQWNFGDGSPLVTTTNGYNYSNHTYGSSLTTYTASVKITSACGNDTTLYSTVQISNTAFFPNQSWFQLSSNSPACPNSSISFQVQGNFSTFVWNFGDGSAQVSTSYGGVNHTYGNTAGNYTASVKITNGCGNDTTLYTTVQIVNNIGFPNQSWFKLDVNPSISCPNSEVNFNAPSGYNTYVWNFGDGSSLATTTNSNNYNNHTYGAAIATYTVSVKITNGCGHDTTLYSTVQISNTAHFPNQSWFQLQANSPNCPNSSVNFNVSGNFSNYIWNFGDGTPLVTSTYGSYNHTYGGAVGNYNASVKITNGCGNDTTLYKTIQILNNIGFPTDSWFLLQSGSSTVCPNDQMYWNAPGGYTNYKWKFGDGDSILSTSSSVNHIYTALGTYSASVKITNNCGRDTTLYGSIVVNSSGSFPNWLQIDLSSNTSCPNDFITFRLNQDSYQSYVWNFGDGQTASSTGANIQHAYAAVGTYTVTCTVANGCSNTTTLTTVVQVTSTSPVNNNVSVEGLQNPSCPNDEVYFMIHQGETSYTYAWNYGDSSPIDTTIGAGAHHIYSAIGVYNVTVTVINGCGATKIITMTETISNGVMPSLAGTQGKPTWGFPGSDNGGLAATAGCAGDAVLFYMMGSSADNVWDFGDGSTGTATESMLINGGDGAMPITIINHAFPANGTYLVSLTITNGCGNSVTDTMSIKIGGNQAVNGQMVSSPPPFTTCAAINFIAYGGSTYAWNFGDGNTLNSPSPSVSHTFSAQGVYVVSVIVTNACGNSATYSTSVNVNGVGGPAVSLVSAAAPTCVDGTDGTATVSVTNGQPPYVYLWNDANGQTADVATGLAPGLYNATVTDDIGCATTLAVSIPNSAPIVLGTSSTTTGCGTSIGTAAVNVTSGGTGPFTYLWSTGETSATETGLAVGTYSVVATDANGCSSSANIGISESGGAVLSINTITNVLCNGSATGAININVTGGTAPYTYVWSNAATTQDVTGLTAGSYSVQVTDFSGCKATLNATVTQTNEIAVATSTTHSPTCGNFDGNAIATPTGGTAPYTYLWDANAGSQTTQTATGLPAGTYSVTVTDFKGCTKDGVISLSNSNSPTISAVVTDVTCNGSANGAIDISVTGGTGPYLYTWSVNPPQTNHQDINTLLPGNYSVFVNDAHGCMSFRNYSIAQPAILTATVSHTDATCGNNDGTATATPVGGNTSFTYLWTGGGQTTQTATGLALGGYTVTVTDNKGCIATGNTTIGATTLPTEICMVTVDPLSTHNIIYWEKPVVTNIDSFRVYREDITNVYTRIGAVAYESLSEYHDYGVNPNTTTKRYKISTLDNCGQESVKSNYHNTIYIVDNGSGQFTWNPLYTIENSTNPVNNYVLMRDNNSTGSWTQVATTAGTQNTLVDPAYASYTNGNWRVETAWGITCNPTRASINTTRSNIKHQSIVTGVNSQEGLEATSIYPNPANDFVSIEFVESIQKAEIRVMNSIGQVSVEQTIVSAGNSKTIKEINTSNFAKGVYTIVIETNKAKVFKKLVVN